MNNTVSASRAGIIASAAMDLVQWAIAARFEQKRGPKDLDEETEAIASVVARLATLAPGTFVEEHTDATGYLIHYLFGAAFALGYARFRSAKHEVSLARGLGFGLVLWLSSDVVLIPAAHLGRNWFRYSTAERANAFASHLAFALTVETILAFDGAAEK